jgi:D-sedoheptulose 7-phosphate isomerase
MASSISSAIKEHREVLQKTEEQSAKIAALAALLTKTLKGGGKLIICGNGGSAADSQHFAAELTGRYMKERRGLSAFALTTDTSAITAISNDYSYDIVFARQIEALGRKGDLLVLISTSGNSQNLLEAAKKAKAIGVATFGLLGKGGGKLAAMCDDCLIVPCQSTPRIQEMHTLVMHCVCQMIDDEVWQ